MLLWVRMFAQLHKRLKSMLFLKFFLTLEATSSLLHSKFKKKTVEFKENITASLNCTFFQILAYCAYQRFWSELEFSILSKNFNKIWPINITCPSSVVSTIHDFDLIWKRQDNIWKYTNDKIGNTILKYILLSESSLIYNTSFTVLCQI